MSEDQKNDRRKVVAPEPSQTPLWLVAVGLGVALYSHTMKDENIGVVVFWFGLAFSVVSLIYWLFRPKHGL